jgi:hypothetical protein
MDPELAQLTIADDPTAWADAGFALEAGRAVVGGVTLSFTGDPDRKGIVAWTLSGVETGAIDGLPTDRADPPAEPVPELSHPNGATTIDHVVAASPDLPRTIAAFGQFGIVPRGTRDTDQYGTPLRQVFFRLGRPTLELIGPPEPSGDRPASFWGLAITVADLDETKDLLGDRLSDPKDAVQPGRRIATLRHEDLEMTVPIAFMSA